MFVYWVFGERTNDADGATCVRANWATSILPEATRMHPTGTTPKRSGVGGIASMAFAGDTSGLIPGKC